ncbi:hypothetical protein KJ885_01285 [Patescibacteria group bacterium]|nr:hypothetical protein [Patescibacteria group bacterium]
MTKKYKMSKSLKIFLIVIAVGIMAFSSYNVYSWVTRQDLHVTISVYNSFTNEDVTIVKTAVSKIGGKLVQELNYGGSKSFLEVRLPWYYDLPGFKSVPQAVETLMAELESNPKIMCITGGGYTCLEEF